MPGGWASQNVMSGFDKRVYLSDEVDTFNWKEHDKEWVQVRYFGPINSYARADIKIRTKTGKVVDITKVCLDYDSKTGTFTRNVCPYRAAGLYVSQRFLSNFIVRDLAEDKPRKQRKLKSSELKPRTMLGEKWHIKSKDSKSWTPVRVQDMPAGLADKLRGLSELNTVIKKGKKQQYDISDPKYGIDILVKYNDKAAGAAKWEVQRAERSPLTDEEKKYLIFNIENLKCIVPEKKSVAREEWERLKQIYIPREKPGDDKSDKKAKSNKEDRSSKRDRRERDRDRDKKSSKKRNKSKKRSSKITEDDLPF